MTIRLPCRYCPTTARTVVETIPDPTANSSATATGYRATAVCPAHETRARRWCATVGPYRLRLLPAAWQQLTIDDALSALPEAHRP